MVISSKMVLLGRGVNAQKEGSCSYDSVLTFHATSHRVPQIHKMFVKNGAPGYPGNLVVEPVKMFDLCFC